MKSTAYKEMFENELSHPWYIATRKLMVNYLKINLKQNAKILDAGCGTGGTMEFLKRAGFKRIYGIDNSTIAISYCKKRGLLKIKNASVDKIPFKSESFDAILCMDVLYHKNVNFKKALSEFRRVLKKNGLLYIQEPAFNWIKGNHDLAIQTKHRFTLSDIKSLTVNNGFNILKISYFNTFFFIPIAIKRILEKKSRKKYTSSDVASVSTFVKIFSTIVLSIESKLLRFINLPIGLSIICICKK